jgi:hypothetical protein
VAVVQAVVAHCGTPLETIFRVDLTDGCASEIEIESSVGGALATCVSEALASKRWSCVGAAACAVYAESTL